MRSFVSFFFLVCCIQSILGEEKEQGLNEILSKLYSSSNINITDDLRMYNLKSGSFIDISYTDTSLTYWQPAKHFERLKRFSEVYTCPRSRYYKSNAIYDRIIQGLNFWIDKIPQSKNWWYNRIKSPMILGQILINMRNGDRPLPLKLEQDCIDKMKDCVQDPYQYVGANRTDIATHWIYRACLTNDDELFKSAIDLVASSIRYAQSEGIMIDNSYCQHDRQIYIGAYGSSFLIEATRWAYLVMGTKYEFPKEKIKILSDFARKTYFPCIRGNHYSYNVCGRSISRRDGINVSSSPKVIAQRLIKLDPTHQEEYAVIIKDLNSGNTYASKSKASHTHYYYTDYTLHSCHQYTFDIKMSSTRTPRCESLNDENLKNYFLSCGGTCLMVSGHEYNDIFPVWDWARIPGVTAPHIQDVPVINGYSSYGETDFAGGVSDSIYGVSAYVYDDTKMKVQAKKSWFFFDKEIVCLGSDISSRSDYPVETTINQCLDTSEAYIRFVGKDTNAQMNICQDLHLKRIKWILHGNVGYYFPTDENIIASKCKRMGSWHSINRCYEEKTEEEAVFHLGINHGLKPFEEKYSYVLVPNVKSSNAMDKRVRGMQLKIVRCERNKHVVYDSGSGTLMAVFFEPGTLIYNKLRIDVDQSCALMIKGLHLRKPNSLHISNLCQGDNPINVSLKYKKYSKNITIIAKETVRAGETQKFLLW